MSKKIRNLLTICILMLSFTSIAYPNKKRIRKPANESFPYESVFLEYAKDSGPIQKIRFHMGPFTKYIALKLPQFQHLRTSDGGSKTVILDCSQDEAASYLNCVSGCGGGTMIVEFNDGIKLDKLKVRKFEDFRPLACDGSETGSEPLFSIEDEISLILKKVKLER